ncbi:MAG: sensory transduction histidine kinase [Candidatus Peregrinibacteria bacterium Greene0416_62]|nr:MAG: sensory transduction histidine kinase [Candidatus Peregrinibacteria bacterium Greene0416_62]TSC99880.1 MAG: sensory transduction histidine kinase [Candidatus Peregrinibacteria bacterium Greene1014_49]
MRTPDPESLYKALADHMREAVHIVDAEDQTLFANERLCTMLGYSLAELRKKRTKDFLDEASVHRISEAHRRERKQGIASSYEATLMSKQGEGLSVYITGIPLNDGATMGIITDLREEKRLETIYRQLVEHMQEGVWMGNIEEKTIYANPRFCTMMEYTPEEILGIEEYTFWDPASADIVRRVNSTERIEGKSSTYEAVLQTKSGKRIPVFVSGSPLPGGGTMALVTDLRPMKERESMYRTLVENMNEVVWMVDREGNTLYVNPKFQEILGYSEEEILGKSAFQIIHPDYVDDIRRIDRQERAKGISSSYETILVTKTGKHIPVLMSGTPLPGGGSMGIFTDLTVVKEKQRKERVLTQAIAYATDGIIIVDETGLVQAWNKGAKLIFGYEEQEVIGKTIKGMFSTQDVDHMLGQSSVRYNFELQGTHKNTQNITISATLTPVFDEGRKMSSILLIARDITAQRKFEEELSLKYQKLKEAYNQFGIVRRQMDYIFELCEASSAYSDIGSVGDFIVNSVIMLTRVDGCVLRIYNPRQDSLDLLSSFGVDESWKGKASVAYKGSLVEQSREKGFPMKVVDITKEPRYGSVHMARMHNFSSLLVVPLQHQKELVGSLTLYVTPEKKLELFENDFIEEYAKLVSLILASRKKTGK